MTSVRFSPESQILAVGTADGAVQIWKWRKGDRIAVMSKTNGPPIYSLRFTGDGKHLVRIDISNTLVTWNNRTWRMKSSRHAEITPPIIQIGP